MPVITGIFLGKAADMLQRCPSAGRICSSPDAAGTDGGVAGFRLRESYGGPAEASAEAGAVRNSQFAVRGSRVRGSRNTISRVRILHMALLGAVLLLLPLG